MAKLGMSTKGSSADPAASPIAQSLPILDPPNIYNSTTPTAATTTTPTKPVLAPATRQIRKRGRAKITRDEDRQEPIAAKLPAKRVRKKKAIMGTDSPNRPQLVWLPALNKAFLTYLWVLVDQGKETNGATFKATDYIDAIAFIKIKSG